MKKMSYPRFLARAAMTLLALFCFLGARAQETLTVYDGTDDDSRVPFYGFLQTASGIYSTCSWYGVQATQGTSFSGYGSNVNAQSFLPKTTFDFTPGKPSACPKPTGFNVNYESGATATVTWNGDATSYNIDVNGTVTEGVSSPYALEGLEMATTYEVKVQAVCSQTETSDWTNTVSFTTDLCLPEDMCAINITLTDSYGDGWNDGKLEVVDMETEKVLGSYTISYGSSADYTLNVCDGRTINIVYTAGSYPTENGWVITDIGDEVICEHDGCDNGCTPTAGVQATYTVNCTDICKMPTDLAATNVMATSATLNWEGFADEYNVRYRVLSSVAEQNFDDSSLGEWTTIDADGDGYGWVLGSEVGGVYLVAGASLAGNGHNASAELLTSGSYSNVAEALTPDNYLVSPKVALGGSISFYAKAQDAQYHKEHFGVAVSTTGNTDAADFTTIDAWTLTNGEWGKFTADLSNYACQDGYVAIRHFGCTDQFLLNIDDIVIEGPSQAETEWITLENISGNSVDIEGLDPETVYTWQVQANCGEDDLNSWSDTSTFTTGSFSDAPTELDASDITSTTATLNWTGSQESYNVQYRTVAFKASEWISATVEEPTLALTDLDPNTEYEWQVQGILDDGTTEWSEVATFTTLPLIELANDAEDNSTLIAENDDVVADVTLVGRTLVKDGNWNTICLPFDLTLEGSPLEGATAKTLANATITGNHVSLTFGSAVTTLEAGKPYIIKWETSEESEENIVDPTFTNVLIPNDVAELDCVVQPIDGVKFIGYYDAFDITAADENIYYMTAGNTLKRTGIPRTLKACRAYFEFSKSAVRGFTLNFGESEASGIVSIDNEQLNNESGWYTVDGKKLDKQPKRKGVYINNGFKVVIK